MRRERGVVEILLHKHPGSANEHLANRLDVYLATTFVSHVQMYCVRGAYQKRATRLVVVEDGRPIKSCFIVCWIEAGI